MTSAQNTEYLALLKFGINVPLQHRDEAVRLIKANNSYREEFEIIKNDLKTMTD